MIQPLAWFISACLWLVGGPADDQAGERASRRTSQASSRPASQASSEPARRPGRPPADEQQQQQLEGSGRLRTGEGDVGVAAVAWTQSNVDNVGARDTRPPVSTRIPRSRLAFTQTH